MAANCNGVEHLFSWPSAEKRPDLYRAWNNWVKMDVKNFVFSNYSCLCFRHFQDDMFSNLFAYSRCHQSTLKLDRDKAVPSIRFRSEESARAVLTPRKRKLEDAPVTKREHRAVLRQALSDPPAAVTTPAAQPCQSSPPSGRESPLPVLIVVHHRVSQGTNTDRVVKPHYRSKGVQVNLPDPQLKRMKEMEKLLRQQKELLMSMADKMATKLDDRGKCTG
ncbi:uncharacterized protein [Watersipora subatra]|uniref:uncharacterized protein isoform X2 n=1 Tax=Watersipora subatra TaxID=2589382 RepID=UPI00355AD0A6